MAEQETEAVEATKSGGSSWLLVVVASVLSATGSAGGAFYLLGGTAAAPAAEQVQAEGADVEAEFAERVLKLEPFVVNVTGEGYPRYLKLQLALEADDLETRTELEARVDQIRDTTILLLSSKRLADVTDFEGKALLKDDLRDRVNALLDGGEVRSVLFTEFVVQ